MSLNALFGRAFVQSALALAALATTITAATHAVQPQVKLVDHLLVFAYVATLLVIVAAVRVLIARVMPQRLRGAVLAISSIAATGFLFIDLRLFVLLGVHTDGPVVRRFLASSGANVETQLGGDTARLFALIGVGLVALEVASFALWRLLRRRELALFAIAMLASIACIGMTAAGARALLDPANPTSATLPLASLLSARHEPTAMAELNYPMVLAGKPATRPNIVFLTVESWRADALTAELMPKTTALLGDVDRCWRSPRHVSGGHTTERGVFSLLYGVDATYYNAFARAGLPSLPIGWLRGHGYHAAAFTASALQNWNDAGFMASQFDPYVEMNDPESWQRDAELVERVTAYVGSATAPYFLFAFLDATHVGYSYPPAFEIDKPVLRGDFGTVIGRERYATMQTEIRNRYRNSVRYVDDNLAKIFSSLSSASRGDTIVVITGDHGEEFWDAGLFGHSAPRFVRSRIEVPFVACALGDGNLQWPSKFAATLSGHADVWPTLMAMLAPHVATADFASGRTLFASTDAAHELEVVAGAGFPTEAPEVAILDGEHKLWLRKDWARDDLFWVQHSDTLDDQPSANPDRERAMIGALRERLRRFLK